MPKEYERRARVAALLKRELAELIAHELDDPRLKMATVTDVDVSRDLSTATVFVTCGRGRSDAAELVGALNGAAGYLRRRLSARIELRSTPVLSFRYDTTFERGMAVERALNKARDSHG